MERSASSGEDGQQHEARGGLEPSRWDVVVRNGVLRAVQGEPQRDRASARAGERPQGRTTGDVHGDDHAGCGYSAV